MQPHLNRRRFLKQSVCVSSAVTAALSFEEVALLAKPAEAVPASVPPPAGELLPTGKVGKLNITRLICGGNLVAGFAHSRDLIYVSELLRKYFTDEKVIQTLALCEAQGINTTILRLDDDTLRILKAYRKQHGGKIQWIAQVEIQEDRLADQFQQAVDNGAVGVFTHGGIGDDLVKRGKVEVLANCMDLIRRQGVIAGIAGHRLEVPKACEQAGVKADFYMKTFNSKRYWSAGPKEEHDNVWEASPEETIAFMQEVDKPWIAYKVLGAGAIHPREGFQYAFNHGADFVCVGMFDFQVAEDVALTRLALDKARVRDRAWCA
ncbi:MAG: hypothetical protein KGS61_06000 [Verrucomicrobia bacterium]|nr:hypothetical protein [Verrucomicrobiota bacterium]